VHKGDFELAHLKAHTLKGEGGNLGADAVWMQAQKVEQTIKDQDTASFDKEIIVLAAKMEKLTTKLTPFFEANQEYNRSTESNIPQLIEKLIAYLRKNDPKALDLLDELATTRMNQTDLETITRIVQSKPSDEAILFLEKYLTTP